MNFSFLAISRQLSAFSLVFYYFSILFVFPDISLKTHSPTPLKHHTPTLTPTRTLNWGGKDIILHHLSQMFLKNYASGHTVFLCTYGAGNGF